MVGERCVVCMSDLEVGPPGLLTIVCAKLVQTDGLVTTTRVQSVGVFSIRNFN